MGQSMHPDGCLCGGSRKTNGQTSTNILMSDLDFTIFRFFCLRRFGRVPMLLLQQFEANLLDESLPQLGPRWVKIWLSEAVPRRQEAQS